MRINNKLSAENFSTASSYLTTSESIFENDEQTAGSSSVLLSSKYYTHSDTEVEEENRRLRKKKSINLNSSYDTSEVGQYLYSPIKSLRRKRGFSSVSLNYDNEDIDDSNCKQRQKSVIRQRQELQYYYQQQKQNSIKKKNMEQQNYLNLNSIKKIDEKCRNSLKIAKNQHCKKKLSSQQYFNNNDINTSLSSKFIRKKRTVNMANAMLNSNNFKNGRSGSDNVSGSNKYYQKKIANYYRATARRNITQHHFYNESIGRCNKQKGKTAVTATTGWRRNNFLRNQPVLSGDDSGYKRQQKILHAKSRIFKIEKCTSPVLLDYCGPESNKKTVEENKTPKVEHDKYSLNKLVNLPKSLLGEKKINVLPPIPTILPPPLPFENQKNYECKNNTNKENYLNLFNHYHLQDLNNETLKNSNSSRLYGNIIASNFDDSEDDNETQFMNISDKIYENLLPNNVPAALINGFNTNKNTFFQNCRNEINGCIVSFPNTTKNVYLTSKASTSQNGTCLSSNCSTIKSGISTFVPAVYDEPELYGSLIRIAITEARNCNVQTIWHKIAEAKLQLDTILYGFDRRHLLLDCNKNNEIKPTRCWQRLPLLLNENMAFEISCNAYCQQVVKRLRNIQANSLKDYNQQICKVQKVVQQLKLAIVNVQKTPLQQKNCTNYLFAQTKVSPITLPGLETVSSSTSSSSSSASSASTESSNGSVGVGGTNVGTLQKFIGRIRSIF